MMSAFSLICTSTDNCATIVRLASLSECRRGNLLIGTRRTIATLHRLMCGVSFGGSRIHGVITSAFLGALYPQFLTGSRAGGFRACRFLVRGISTPHGLPSPWKGRAVLQTVLGALAMMRTLSRGVSSEFPSSIEPIYRPVESRVKRERVCLSVNPLPSIATASETLLQRLSVAKVTTDRLPSTIRRARARVQLRKCLSELISLCTEVEALSATSRGC